MEVKPGYKQTEVGVIPEDWDGTTVRNIASPIRNAIVGGPFGSDLISDDYVEDGVPVIRGQNMGLRYVSGSFAFVSPSKAESLESNLARPGDLLFTQRGTVGQISIVPDQPYDRYLVSQSQMKLTVDRKAADPLFFYYVFSSSKQQEFIRQSTIQTGVPHINLGILRIIPIQRPPLYEQEAIAEALSDADALIESLGQLLAKKCLLKLGAMQELLTGKKRLPGFSKAWGNVRLRDLLSYERPDRYIVQDTEYTGHGDIPVLTANKSFVLGYTGENFGVCSDLPAIIFDDFTTASKYVDFPFKVRSSAIKLLRPKHDQVDLRFLFDRMQLIHFPLGDHKRYYISEFQNLEVGAPDRAEQQAIAAVLSDMEADIAALEARLAKARQLKQGMMQELLTGRIRLVRPVSSLDQRPVVKGSVPTLAKSHNWQINEAVVISVLVKRFGSEHWPLGRKRYTKLLYLLHRRVEGQAEGYLKKADGPYNPAAKYKGPEGIALKNGYVRAHSHDRFSGFVAAERISEAESYFSKWYGDDVLPWLEQFRRKSNDELELLATVDMAMEDLRRSGRSVDLATVKQVIQGHSEWKDKLNRAIFSDDNIALAIESCRGLFAPQECDR